MISYLMKFPINKSDIGRNACDLQQSKISGDAPLDFIIEDESDSDVKIVKTNAGTAKKRNAISMEKTERRVKK